MEKDNKADSSRERLNQLEERLETALHDENALAAVRHIVRELVVDHPEEASSVRLVLDQSLAAEKIDLRFHSLVYATLEDVLRQTSTSTLNDVFGVTTVIAPGAAAGSAESRAQIGSILRDRFVLRERIADGFLGTVFKAQDRHLADGEGGATWVAVKIIQPQVAQNAEALKILQQEAAKSRCLVHPNIVRFIDLDREDEILFTVADWIDGRTLATALSDRSGEPFSIAESLRLIQPLANALEYAHRCGVVHGDVKPDTVMLTPNGIPMLFDFGLARLRHLYNRPGKSPQASASTSYSSMQILTGETPDVRDDVFSLACLFYRLVAGHRVFGPRNAVQAAEEAMQAQRPPGLSTRQWDALGKALAFSRVSRQRDVSEFMVAIGIDEQLARDEQAQQSLLEPRAAEADEPAQGDAVASLGGSHDKRAGIGWIMAIVVLAGVILAWLSLWDSPDVADFPANRDDSAASAMQVESGSPAAAIVTADEGVANGAGSPTGNESTESPPALDSLPDSTASSTEVAEPSPGARPADGKADADPALDELVSEEALAGEAIVDIIEMTPAGLIIPIGREPDSAISLALTLREDQPAVVIEITRSHNLEEGLNLQLAEVAFTGNRSPLADGQYLLLNDGRVEFAPGQAKKRLQVVMRNDTTRESDRRATLALVDREAPDRVYGTLSVLLEDDDQRRFEAGLPVDTIAFSVAQVASREQLPAVQIELLRLNAGSGEFATSFDFVDQSAVEGEDYFVPTQKSIRFQPGQRSTRLFIPLVQDSEVEGDETFVLELAPVDELDLPGVNRRITVLIRDDDEATETVSPESQ